MKQYVIETKVKISEKSDCNFRCYGLWGTEAGLSEREESKRRQGVSFGG